MPIRLVNLCPYPVLPLSSGGKIRIVKLARQLSQAGVDVTVVTPYHPRQTRRLMRSEPFRLIQISYPFIHALLLTERPFPYQYWTSFHPGLGVLLRRFLLQADIVQFEHVQFARLALQLPPEQVVVYGSHNVEYDYARAECRSAWSADLVGRRIARLERSLVLRSQHILTVSMGDSDRLSRLYGINNSLMTVAPNGLDLFGKHYSSASLVMARFPRIASFALRALYCGSDVVHNRIAVQFILAQVAPLRPDVAFVILGACGHSFSRSCRLENVFFDPVIDHFDDYAGLGFRGLNTVTTGSGSNLKLLHYLSRGMQVTSTNFGIRGFEELVPYVTMCDLEHVHESFDDPWRPGLPDALLRKYDWATVAGTIHDVYRTLLAHARSCCTPPL